jgi:neurotransmitter:Na+ symporter, NSS family
LATTPTNSRGTWNTKIGFILAAAGSAVGLGNIWRFPTVMAENGGAAFLFIYALLVFIIGYPVMVAELSIGRRTKKNPVGAFRALSNNKIFTLAGFWCVICGVAILSFYVIIAGWTISYFFEQIFYYLGFVGLAEWVTNLDNGWLNAGVAILFMGITIAIILGGVSQGIEKAVRLLMPMLVVIIIILIVYVMFQPGAGAGLREYLVPDFSAINMELILAAMGQAFFSLSLGMGALITYGSYLNKRENIPEAAGYVTGFDVGIAFLAGMLIMPTIYMAQAEGLVIYDEAGNLVAGTALIFQVLPELFHEMGGIIGLIFGATFFLLLTIAALTSSISLLEVPTSYVIDEHNIPRKKAAVMIGGFITIISLFIAFDTSLIDTIDFIFSVIGLPLGGFFVCIFLAYFWKTENAKIELRQGFENIDNHLFWPIWLVFIKFICPILIALILGSTIYSIFQ